MDTVIKKKKRNGGTVKKSKCENDIYFNSYNASELFEYLKPHFIEKEEFKNGFPMILDACCGDKALGQAVDKILNGLCVVDYQDIKLSGESILDFKGNKQGYNLIICNPPWVPVEIPEAIYYHLIELLSPSGILVFIINNVFCYQGWDRAKKLPYQKYYHLPRYTFLSSKKPLLDPGVMVYHKDNCMPIDAGLLRPFILLSKIKESDKNNLFEQKAFKN